MSIHISVESIQGKQRKEIIAEIQHQAKKAALSAIKNVLEAGLEAEVEGQLGRKKGKSAIVVAKGVSVNGDVGIVDARMPISFCEMDTIGGIWKRDGDLSRDCAFRCSSVNSAVTM